MPLWDEITQAANAAIDRRAAKVFRAEIVEVRSDGRVDIRRPQNPAPDGVYRQVLPGYAPEAGHWALCLSWSGGVLVMGRHGSGDTPTGFVTPEELAEELAEYLPLDGSRRMSGDLFIAKGAAEVILGNGGGPTGVRFRNQNGTRYLLHYYANSDALVIVDGAGSEVMRIRQSGNVSFYRDVDAPRFAGNINIPNNTLQSGMTGVYNHNLGVIPRKVWLYYNDSGWRPLMHQLNAWRWSLDASQLIVVNNASFSRSLIGEIAR